VRALTNLSGAVTDTYDYDAFGNIVHSTGSTPNVYLYSGEQFDPDLHLYYNRARYLNVTTGRFWTMDAAEPNFFEPLSLHRYLYAEADSVNRLDPSGEQATVAEVSRDIAINLVLFSMAILATAVILRTIKAEVGMRLNHYTQWIYLPFIMLGGIDSPSGTNYFTPDFYLSGAEAKSKLALKTTPQVIINLTVYSYTDGLHGPEPVRPANGELGGGTEYSTARVVPFWTSWPVLFPLQEEIDSFLPKPLQ
jgi:RHS repeat-associated protein